MEVSYHNRPHFEEQSMQIDPPQQSQSSPTVRPGLNRHELVKEVRGREKEIREQLRPGRKTVRMLTSSRMPIPHTRRTEHREPPQGIQVLPRSSKTMSLTRKHLQV